MTDLISVIIPVYNGENSLERCINSVLSSTYLNLEIILIDDGSTDNSPFLCDRFSSKYRTISVYHLKNGGVSKARNYGISKAKGKYLSFIDCDDYITSNYFLDLYNNIKQTNSELSIGSIANIDGQKISYVYAEDKLINLKDNSRYNQKNFLELHQLYLLYGPVNKLYITSYIKEHNIKFPENTSYGEDLLFNMTYVRYCSVISCIKTSIYYYDHNNIKSLSHKYRDNIFENGLRLNQVLMDTFKYFGFFDENEKKYVYRRIFDDAYNSIFNLWNPRCTDSFPQKVKKVNLLLKHEEVQKACQIAELSDYSKLYFILMSKKKGLIIVVIREIMSRLHK